VQDRLRWLKFAAHMSIYTPGSDAGLPVSILASLAAPREGWDANEEGNREKITAITTALLALVGRNSQPITDKEHVLISNIFEYEWRRGMSPTLEDIILMVQKPPFQKLGVFPIDEYISEKQRAKLAMDLNNIVAAPSFQSWINGDPMDIQSLLYLPDGRARVSIFYTAHLNETERQFIMTLLLENVLSWMRVQSGTTSLRALLYIDEMFGYFPPYPFNPPTKNPILQLLKQARAYGLGLILATQNPGDLDYKGLSNAGTWFIGRLQSEQDRARVMTGLEALADVSNEFNLKEINRLIADIPPRVFLMHNVHDRSGPEMLHTRWAMSYLRGPLTRQQIAVLMADQKRALAARLGVASTFNQSAPVGAAPVGGFAAQVGAYAQTTPRMVQPQSSQAFAAGLTPPPVGLPELPPTPNAFPELPEAPTATAPAYDLPPAAFASQPVNAPIASGGQSQLTRSNNIDGIAAPNGYSVTPPPLSQSVSQYFLPTDLSSEQAMRAYEQRTGVISTGIGGAALAYRPVLIAQATVRYQDRKTQVFTAREYAFRVPSLERAGIVRWEDHRAAAIDARRVSGEPFQKAFFGDLPSGLTDSKRMTALKNELLDLLYNTARLVVPYSAALNLYGNPDREFSEFSAQLQQVARERRQVEVDELTAKYDKQLDALEEKLQREARTLEGNRRELATSKREELFTTGEALLGLIRGQTSFTLSRMSRAQYYKQRNKSTVELNELELEQLQQNAEELQVEFTGKLQQIDDKWAAIATRVDDYQISPYKKDISVDLFGIGWLPYWYIVINGQGLMMPALNEV
jgi:Skp family chaperone for outer membrane proteins